MLLTHALSAATTSWTFASNARQISRPPRLKTAKLHGELELYLPALFQTIFTMPLLPSTLAVQGRLQPRVPFPLHKVIKHAHSSRARPPHPRCPPVAGSKIATSALSATASGTSRSTARNRSASSAAAAREVSAAQPRLDRLFLMLCRKLFSVF